MFNEYWPMLFSSLRSPNLFALLVEISNDPKELCLCGFYLLLFTIVEKERHFQNIHV